MGLFAGLVAVLLLAASMGDYLAPIHFTITPEYVECRNITGKKRILWSAAINCKFSDDGMLISSVDSSSPLVAFRGVTLYFEANRDEVIDFVRNIRKKAE